jgi:hypothetical protein
MIHAFCQPLPWLDTLSHSFKTVAIHGTRASIILVLSLSLAHKHSTTPSLSVLILKERDDLMLKSTLINSVPPWQHWFWDFFIYLTSRVVCFMCRVFGMICYSLFLKIFLDWKCIKIFFFYVLKFIFDTSTSKRSKNIKKLIWNNFFSKIQFKHRAKHPLELNRLHSSLFF